MVQFSKNLQKNAAIDLRKKGFSYSEIKKEILVPKSTLSHWFRKIKLSEAQNQKLKDRRFKIAKANSEGRTLKTLQKIEEIKDSSGKDLRIISKRELWLMGIVLYWRERFLHNNESDLHKGVRFTSSDPNIIKLFLKWLRDIGQLKKEEIGFDIFMGRNDKQEIIAETINYWSQVTNMPKDYFPRIYFQKNRRKKTKRKSSRRAYHGLLRIRVKASSMLARQISGWVRAIVNQLNKP
ncbi:MAG: hypothetical protein HYX20_01765 [Candidatus Yanofskybacteria bacterium]|nr:hypothetical protein [Candidatus Yanofskybacteria bacterium]